VKTMGGISTGLFAPTHSASRPDRALPPGKGPHGTHWTGGWWASEPV